MDYLAVKDLKRSKLLWQKLDEEHELVITRDGKPCAIMIGVSPENLENDISAIRRALFSSAITRARLNAKTDLPKHKDIEKAIKTSRKERGIR